MKLANRIRRQADGHYDDVDVAFLELAVPSIPDGLSACVRRGAGKVVVLPYFLAAGRHVTNDIPGIVDRFRADHPDVDVEVAPHLGASDFLPEALLDAAGCSQQAVRGNPGK